MSDVTPQPDAPTPPVPREQDPRYTREIPDGRPTQADLIRHLNERHNAEPDGIAWRRAVKLRAGEVWYDKKLDEALYEVVAVDTVLNTQLRVEMRARKGASLADSAGPALMDLIRRVRLVPIGMGMAIAADPDAKSGEGQDLLRRIIRTQLQIRERTSRAGRCVIALSATDFPALMDELQKRVTSDPLPNGPGGGSVVPRDLDKHHRAVAGYGTNAVMFNGDCITWSADVKPGRIRACGATIPNTGEGNE